MSFPRYPEYKDSGVEWLGEVPGHWEVCALKRDLTFLTSGSRGWAEHYSDDGAAFIRIGNLTRESINLDLSDLQRVMVPEGVEGERTKVEPGDLLFSITAYLGSVAVVPEELETAYVSQHVALARLRRCLFLPAWVGYVTLSHVGKTYLETQGYGGTKIQLSLEDVASLIMTVPPLPEQSAIAAFLDRETGKIDALVAEQEKLIALLAEKRQAVISHAVTKGLNPAARMKDSGIEWLGEVPEHWEVSNLKRFWHVIDCKHVTADFVDDGIPLASIREVQGRFIDLTTSKKTTELFYDLLIEDGRKPLQGDLIFSRNATVGEVAQVADWHPIFAMGQDVCLLRRRDEASSSDFLHSALRSKVVSEQLALCMIGSTFKRVNVEEIRNLVVPMPSPDEQEAIATYLDQQTTKFDALTAEAQRAIALLKEHRSALISAAVTGKIDVRGLTEKEAA